MELFRGTILFTCSIHNYTSLTNPCPICYSTAIIDKPHSMAPAVQRLTCDHNLRLDISKWTTGRFGYVEGENVCTKCGAKIFWQLKLNAGYEGMKPETLSAKPEEESEERQCPNT